jgi:hypothetical protein
VQELFPTSYKSLERWLRGEAPADPSALERAREWLTDALAADPGLITLVGGTAGVTVKARRKSLFSTCERVYGTSGCGRTCTTCWACASSSRRSRYCPRTQNRRQRRRGARGWAPGEAASSERSAMAACYRAQQIAHSVFDIVSGHTKDYLQRLMSNGY